MVNHTLFIGILSLSVSSSSIAAFDADSLKKRLDGHAKEKQTAADRLKSSQGNTGALKMITDNQIYYKLPNGKYKPGLLLPNGKIAPAITVKRGKKQPACVTNDYTLVPGRWNTSKAAIECDIPQESLAFIDGHTKASQYSNTTPSKRDGVNTRSQDLPIEPASKYGNNSSGSLSNNTASNADTTESSGRKRQGNGNNPTEGNNNQPAQPVKKTNPYIYRPPSVNNTADVSTSAGVLGADKNRYGILKGTWIRAELVRNVSSAESGEIEFTIIEEVEGKYRTLPLGTTVFANKAFNEAASRLEGLTTTATLPDGNELSLRMRVFSLDKTAGLTGNVLRDRKGELASSGTNAALNVLQATTPVVNSVAGTAINSVSSDMITNEKQYAPKKPRAVIHVSPREVLLQVAVTF